MSRQPSYVTDIKPGLVDAAMIRGGPEEEARFFWVATSKEAARQMYRAIYRRKK